ncbi:MAG: M28 family metallopeptidase [Pseudomonadota bacterium]
MVVCQRISASIACLAMLLSGCELRPGANQTAEPFELSTVDMTHRLESADTIKAHMAFLADDLLEGRAAGSRGEALSALYVASTYEQLGLDPRGEGDAFIQPVPLRSAKLDLESVAFRILKGNQTDTFVNGEDIFVSGSLSETSIHATVPAVFVGHGITAPEYGLADYDSVDVRGKLVVVFGGPPAFLPSAEAAHFGSTAVKQKLAAEAGAIGLIRLWTPANEAQISFDLLKNYLSGASMTWIGPQGEVKDSAPEIKLRATIRGPAADALFANAKMSAAEVIEAGETGPVKGFPLTTSVFLALTTQHDDGLVSGNVAGFLSGSDPLLKDEVVVVTAHYDHVGICKPEGEGDRICNGALDNALGTAAMMDVARRFTVASERPRRSVLFLAVGAEEKGLLGSDYFATYPTLGEKSIVANINMDGGFPFYDFSDVIAFGAEQSTLGEMLAKAVGPMGLKVGPAPFPQQGIFTRSDQYSFVKKGIPALFLYNGFTNLAGENVGLGIWNRLLQTSYHQPSDDLSLLEDYSFAGKYAEVFYRVVREVANADTRPQWYKDSLFGAIYAPRSEKADAP